MRLVDIDSVRYNGGPECPPWVSREQLENAAMSSKAVEAVMKSKPKEVKRQKESGNIACPGCGFDILFMPMNMKNMQVTYCWRCGQAIRWRTEDGKNK